MDPKATDWSRVSKDYDYLWVEPFPEAIPYITAIADPIFSNQAVTVYRMRRAAATGGRPTLARF